MGQYGNGGRFVSLSTKINVDGDCSREIKRDMLLGKKAMTNLNSMLRSRDITLPIKVHLVKAVIFPVVMYRCESWTIKKAECQKLVLLNCSAGEDFDAGRDGGQEEKGTTGDEMAGWHH